MTAALVLVCIAFLVQTHVSLLRNQGNLFALRLALAKGTGETERTAWADQAVDLYQAALVRAPQRADLWMQLSEIYVQTRNWDGAQRSYSTFRSAGGDTHWAVARLRALGFHQGWCPAENQKIFPILSQLSNAFEAYRVLGDLCVAAGHVDAGIEAYQHALMLSADDDLTMLLASAYLQRADETRGDLADRSMADYREVIDLVEHTSPGRREGKGDFMLAWSYWQLNRFDEALRRYESCFFSKRASDTIRFVCALYLGHAYALWLPEPMRDLQKALQYYQQAQTLAPGDTRAKTALEKLEERLR